MSAKAKDKVLNLISRHLDRIRLGEASLDVVPGEIEKRDGWWYVPVRASAQPPSMFQYYEALADVEAELGDKHHINVWLIPTVPD